MGGWQECRGAGCWWCYGTPKLAQSVSMTFGYPKGGCGHPIWDLRGLALEEGNSISCTLEGPGGTKGDGNCLSQAPGTQLGCLIGWWQHEVRPKVSAEQTSVPWTCQTAGSLTSQRERKTEVNSRAQEQGTPTGQTLGYQAQRRIDICLDQPSCVKPAWSACRVNKDLSKRRQMMFNLWCFYCCLPKVSVFEEV